ncbi:MAG: hypothetical protein JSW60_02000 [Thermoplasmatales archaeon]|nr:MAG: hypothetical protein JSW60_02000 [Thermoplasmatales archaeon]
MDEVTTGRDTRILRGSTLKKSIILLICIIILSLSLSYIIGTNARDEKGGSQGLLKEVIPPVEEEPPTPPGSNRGIDAGRHVLEVNDESPHKISRREWWYFNVFFNDPKSDLKDWSMIVTFNKMARLDIRYLDRDSLFIILFDDNDKCYSFNTLGKPRGTFKAEGAGVNLMFEKSWVKGRYPNWHVHAEYDLGDFIADLDFTADFMPVWVEGRSSNLPIGGYMAGDYYIPRCKVEGDIVWDGNEYKVFGVGYHDHVWESNIPRFVSRGWDWFNLHFENGWEMYISKFNLRRLRDVYAGAIVISPNNRNLVEFMKFKLITVESASPQELPSMLYPKKVRLEAERDDMALTLDIQIYNNCEIVWKRARTGMFEGPCYATGTFSWSGHTVELNGYGFSEFTRVRYLLERPYLFIK